MSEGNHADTFLSTASFATAASQHHNTTASTSREAGSFTNLSRGATGFTRHFWLEENYGMIGNHWSFLYFGSTPHPVTVANEGL